MEKTDKELISDYRNGDETALNMLFQRYKNRIFNFCLRILDNRADAEDATSEVFMKLFDKNYIADPNAQFSTWLFTIARNNCIDRLRKNNKTVSLWVKNDNYSQVEIEVADQKDIKKDEMIKKETKAHVKLAIRKLPPEQKEALILREYNKMSYAEISGILGCSLENVKILIFRARENLRVQLLPLIKGENNG